jgi:hypothetical protein
MRENGYMPWLAVCPCRADIPHGRCVAFFGGMIVYDRKTVYIVGDAKSPENNPITKQYQAFFIAFVIHRVSGEIVDAECSATVPITKKFVASLFKGKNMLDSKDVVNEISNRYFGSSQKALIVAFKDAQKKFRALRERSGLSSSE